MSKRSIVLTRLKPWLPLAAAVTAVVVLSAQTPDADRAGSVVEPQTGAVKGKVTAGKGVSVVWIEGMPGKPVPKPGKPPVISQKALRFVPHVMAIPVGTSVDFLNGDNVQHNIFWPAISGNKKMSHSLGTWPKGQTRAFQFTTAGIVPLLCNVHPEMSAYIVVTPTPFLAETDDSGSFEIADIPDGSYMLTAWHEGFKTQSKAVTVASTVKVDFTLTK